MSVINGLGRKNGVGAAVALALLGGTSHALAQQAERGFSGVEEIVVTARKREETIQNTPVSMTAFSGEGIEARNIDSFSDLSNFAPNLDISGGIPNGGGSATQIFIRGVGQDDYSFPNEPGVGLYIDGVYISRSAAGDFGFLDIDRIEVLRGPQGTLYGRNTIGGAVKVITAAPSGELGGRVGATVGSYNRRDIFGHLDFPISDTVSGKIGGALRKRDGLGTNFIGQDLGNTDEITTRGALRFQPSDDLDIIFRADYLRQRQDGPAGSMVRFDPNDATEGLINALIAPARAAELGLQPPFDRYGDAWVRTLATDGRGVYNSGGTVETRDWADIWGISMAVDWAIGDLALNSITAFRDYDIDIRRDSEHTPFDIVQVDNPETYWQLSQEFQLNGLSMDGRLNWVVGLYGLLEDGKSELFAPLISGLFDLIGFDNTALINSTYEAYSVAAFGEATYALTDRVGITFGGRLTRDSKEYVYGLVRPESGQVPLPPETLNDSWNEFLPKLGVEYQITPDVLLYSNVSRGYKAGGYNSRALSGIPPKAFDPEYINAFEVGFKSAWLDNTLVLNGAAFLNDYKDIQLLAVLDLGGGNVETVIENAGKGRIIGGELELFFVPTDALNLGLGVGVLDAKYRQVDDLAQQAGILESNEFINAPELSITASAEYTAQIGGAGSLTLRADGIYKSEQYRDAVNTPELRASAYTLLNSRVTYRPNRGHWSLSFFVNNITDKLYVTSGVEVLGLGYVEAYYSRPREWGAAFALDF